MSDREVCDAIIADCERDAKAYDGKPFTGKTLGEIHGNLLAMVSTLAKIVTNLIDAHAADCRRE